MKDTTFITSILALKCWQEAHEEGLSGMMAVAFAIRNRIRAGWYNGNWIEVLAHMQDVSAKLEPPTINLPDTRTFSFMQFMQIIDGIFAGATDDNVTIKADGDWKKVLSAPAPVALYWARLDQITNPWFLEKIARNPEQHARIAQVGQTFFFS